MAGSEGASPESVGMREFEFDEAQNSVMVRLSSTMRFVGLVNLIGAVLYGFSGIMRLWMSVTQPSAANVATFLVVGSVSALFYFTGRWTTHAAGSFKHIATTAGSDISNLMTALADLLKLYRLQRVIIIASLCVVAIAIGLMIVGLILGAGAGGPAA
jgi:hypothetical protein